MALGPSLPVDMAGLVEDVVSTVYAGHVHSSSSSILFHMAEDVTRSLLEDESFREVSTSSIDNTMVVVRIDNCSQCSFITQPAVWKRLLMNMFGNALKYTQRGSILVHLLSEDLLSQSVDRPKRSKLTLSITDTGRGIASDYLKHRVFKPFNQENDLDVGAGLGLSIVQQLARSMGAKIGLQSEINVGTKISVSVELDASPLVPNPQSRLQSRASEANALCAGKEACFLGFDLLPSMSEATGDELSPQSRQLITLRSSLSAFLTKPTLDRVLQGKHRSTAFWPNEV
jgi:Histidine kinase-, DNA gyrase B-, and HSP90-like ATPase